MPGPTYATFAGSIKPRGFDFTFAPGVQPSVCRVTILPPQTVPVVGTLVLQTTGGESLSFSECLLESPELSAGPAGQFITLPIKDRRWKWQPPLAPIYGHYNQPEANGTYRNETTPQELASMLFIALGETGYDVSRLPNTTRPEKRWDGAYAAIELDSLCAELSCVVTLNPLTDKAVIWPIGSGNSLPAGASLGRTATPVLPAQPSRIKVEAAETLFQATFPTEPVGLDTDGTWRHINNLSYAPASGWPLPISGFGGIFPDTATYISGGKTLKLRDLAESCVYRCYRLLGVRGWTNGCAPPLTDVTFLTPADFRDLRFFNELAEEQISTGAGPQQGGLVPMESRVYARWERLGKLTPPQVTLYPDGFSFDETNWIVQFGEPLFLFSGSGVCQPATVQFECSFFAGAMGIHHRRSVIVGTNQPPTTTPMRLEQRPDIQARVIYRFDSAANQTGVEDNLAVVDSQLNYWKDAYLAEYGLQDGATVTYNKLVRIAPDGLTQQITWSGGAGRPAATIASQAQRHNRFIQPVDTYRDRLRAKKIEQQLTLLAAAKAASLI